VKTASYYAAFFALLSGLATFKLASERFVWLNDIEEEIYVAHFGAHTGQSVTRPMFKKLMRGAKFYTCTADKRIITRGEPVPLVLLLEGTAVITAPSQSSWGVIGEEANKKRRGHSAPMIEIVRGRGFYGEISFVHSMTSADDKYDVEQKVNDYHLPRADVSVSAGSRVIVWHGDEVREMLRRDRPLANALMSNLAVVISNKLYDSTSSMDEATGQLQHSRSKRDEAEYAHAALGITLHTLLGTLSETIELVRQAGKAGKLTEALTAPGTGHKLHFSLEKLRRKNAMSLEEHERVLTSEGLIKQNGNEPVYGPDAPSLLELCERIAAKHDVHEADSKCSRHLSLGADSHRKARVVRQMHTSDAQDLLASRDSKGE